MGQKTLNFNSKQILSKEELIAWDESQRELIGNILRYSRTTDQVAGSLDYYDTELATFKNNFFEVMVGSIPSGGYNTLKITEGRGILDVSNTSSEFVSGLSTYNHSLQNQLVTLFKWETKDNIEIPGISGYGSGVILHVGFVPIYNPLEVGLCSITVSNQVTISGSDFRQFRGQSTKNPTKVRFYKENGSAAINNEIYEVISVVDPHTIIISGNLSTESNVKIMNVGSYDLSAQGSLTDKYSYVQIEGVLTFTTTEADITNNGGFIIATVHMGAAGSFSIHDQRENYLFQIGSTSDVMYKSVSQSVTGAKTFEINSPIFNIPVVNKLNEDSFSVPLGIGTVTSNVLTIPNNGGNVFRFKAVGGLSTLIGVTLSSGLVPGSHIYLYLDPTGVDVSIWQGTTAFVNRIVVPGATEGVVAGTIKKGSLIELWADADMDWQLVNPSVLEPMTTWNMPYIIDDFTNRITPTYADIKYKVDRDDVVLSIVKLDHTTINFPIHFTIPYSGPAVDLIIPTNNFLSPQWLEFHVDSAGECTMTNTSGGVINNQIIFLHN